MDEKHNKDMNIYFVSEVHKLIFALLYTDKKTRMKLLDITEELYEDKEKAKKWYRRISKLIHPDICKVDGCKEADTKLNELYNSMVSTDE